jgi:hypothetical protein
VAVGEVRVERHGLVFREQLHRQLEARAADVIAESRRNDHSRIFIEFKGTVRGINI